MVMDSLRSSAVAAAASPCQKEPLGEVEGVAQAGGGGGATSDVCSWLEAMLDVQCREVNEVMRRRHEDILLDLRSKMLLKRSSSGRDAPNALAWDTETSSPSLRPDPPASKAAFLDNTCTVFMAPPSMPESLHMNERDGKKEKEKEEEEETAAFDGDLPSEGSTSTSASDSRDSKPAEIERRSSAATLLPFGSAWNTFVVNRRRVLTDLTTRSKQVQHKEAWSKSKSKENRDFNKIVMKSELGDDDHDAILYKIVLSPRFELLFALLILANAIIMAMEAQYNGLDDGYEIKYEGIGSRASESWPWASDLWIASEWFFGLVFLVELILKIAALRRVFFIDIWNIFDSFIVLSWLLERISEEILPISPGLLRLTRLIRLLRLVRLVRTIQGFDSLYLMTASIASSFSALGWSSAILLLGELMNALVLQMVLEQYFQDDSRPLSERQQVFERFGTCSKAMLTMFEMMFGNWYTITRILVSNVSEWFMLYGIAHQLIVGFAVLEVITGIFFHETFKVASMDDSIMMSQKNRQNKVHREKMDILFHYADRDGSGSLDRDEFKQILGKSEVRTWLAAMDLDISDVDTVFTLLASEDGSLTAMELVEGVARLKGPARSIDVISLLKMVKTLESQVMDKLANYEELLKKRRSSGRALFERRTRASSQLPRPPKPPTIEVEVLDLHATPVDI